MDKDITNSKTGNATDKVPEGTPKIIVGNGDENVESPDKITGGSQNPKDNTKKQSPYILWLKHKCRRRIARIKIFMRREDAAEWTMVWLTCAIVLFTATSIYFTCSQISIYEKTTQDDLRAYVDSKLVSVIIAGKDSVECHWVITNSGKTPAKRVQVGLIIASLELSAEDMRQIVIPYNYFTLGGGDNDTSVITEEIDHNLFEEFRQNKSPIYFAIRIQYDDIFLHRHSFYGQIRQLGNEARPMQIPDED